jgi:uncharacterized membrane protein
LTNYYSYLTRIIHSARKSLDARDFQQPAKSEIIKVEHSVIVSRSVEEVFSFLGNFEQDPHWQSGIIEAKQIPEGVTLVGTTVRQVRQFLGRRLDYTGDVIEYEENQKIWVKSLSGPYPFEGGYTLEPIDGGTQVTFLLRVQPSGVIRFTQSMVARELKNRWRWILAGSRIYSRLNPSAK